MNDKEEKVVMRVVDIVKFYSPLTGGDYKINTEIYKDAKISGDDAFQMLSDISSEFNVDFSSIRAPDYWPQEGYCILHDVPFLKKSYKSLKIKHLVEMILNNNNDM